MKYAIAALNPLFAIWSAYTLVEVGTAEGVLQGDTSSQAGWFVSQFVSAILVLLDLSGLMLFGRIWNH